MKMSERVVTERQREEGKSFEQQYGFMPRKSTADTVFALRLLMEKYGQDQRELCCVFLDLEKPNEWVPREELWFYMKKS